MDFQDHIAQIAERAMADDVDARMAEMIGSLPSLVDRFYSDSSEWADYNCDAFSEHSGPAKETLRELAEQIHLDPDNADFAEFGRYVFMLMDSYIRSVAEI